MGPTSWREAARWALMTSALAASGCAVVPVYERGHLADPTMQVSVDRAEERSARKLHTSREAAAGGDAQAAGGGCSCGN